MTAIGIIVIWFFITLIIYFVKSINDEYPSYVDAKERFSDERLSYFGKIVFRALHMLLFPWIFFGHFAKCLIYKREKYFRYKTCKNDKWLYRLRNEVFVNVKTGKIKYELEDYDIEVDSIDESLLEDSLRGYERL